MSIKELENSTLVQRDANSKIQKSNDGRNTECIICWQKYFRKDSRLFRLCETKRVDSFLCAAKFNMDSVFTKGPIYGKPDDQFAGDIMSYKNASIGKSSLLKSMYSYMYYLYNHVLIIALMF